MSAKPKLSRALKTFCLKLLEKAVGKTTVNPSEITPEKIRRILIIRRHDDLKDLMITTPVFRAVKQRFPEAHIGVLARADIAPVLLNNVYLDEIISFENRLSGWSFKKTVNLIKKIRSHFDLVIVLNTVTHSFLSDSLAYLTGAKYILGSEHFVLEGCKNNFFYNLIAPYSEINKHQTERNLDIVRHIEADTRDFSEEIYLTKEEKKCAVAFLKEQKVSPVEFLLAVHIGSDDGQSRWPVTKFVHIAKFFCMNYDAKIIASWGLNDNDSGREFISGLPFQPIEVNHLDFREFAAVVFFSNLMICNESAFMHLAAGVGIPVVALFGQTDPHQWKPVGKQIIAIQDTDGKCSSISEEQVIQISEKILERYSKASRLNFEDFDISDKILEKYLYTFDT